MKARHALYLAILSSYVVACVDLSPVRYVPKDAVAKTHEDAGGADAAISDAAADNYIEECGTCLSSMCGTALDACNAVTKCSSMAKCMTETKCWNEKIVDFNNPPMCISSCSQQADITTQVDPALGPFISVLICAQGPTQCAPTCAPVFLP